MLLQVDYMGVVQEVTHKLQVKTITIDDMSYPDNAKKLPLSIIEASHSGAPATKVTENTL